MCLSIIFILKPNFFCQNSEIKMCFSIIFILKPNFLSSFDSLVKLIGSSINLKLYMLIGIYINHKRYNNINKIHTI